MYQGCTVGTRDIVYHNTGTEVGERAGMYQEYSECCTKRYAPVTHFNDEFSPGENEITPGTYFVAILGTQHAQILKRVPSRENQSGPHGKKCIMDRPPAPATTL